MKKNNRIAIIILAIIIFTTIIIFLLISYENFETVNRDVYEVSDKHNDGRTFAVTNGETGYGNEDGDWATLQLSPSYSFGVLFTNISINHSANIKEAYIELYCIGTPGHRNPNCRIYCDDVDNANNFSTTGVLNISGRIYTNTYKLWNTSIPYGKWVKTPSLVKPMQEVINRENWVSGNSIAFLFVTEGLSGYSTAFQNYENGYPAKLHVEWIQKN
jgi:hypothetical protein